MGSQKSRMWHFLCCKSNLTLVVVQSLSHVWLFVTPWTVACQTSLSFTISWEFAQTHVHRVDDAIQPFHPLLPPSPPALNLSQHQGLFPRDSQESSLTPQFKNVNSSAFSLLHCPTLTSIHDYWKNHSFDYMDLCQQSYVSAFNTLFRFVIAFLPRIKPLLISWVQSTSTVILEPRNNKICHCFCFFPFCLSWSDGTRCHDPSFLNVEF